MEIQVDIGTMKSKIKNAQNKREDMVGKISSITNQCSQFKQYWSGSDYDNFEKNINEFLKNINGFAEQIKNINKYLEKYVEGIEQIDEHFSNKSIDME